MKEKDQYYPVPSFDNIDPLEVDHGYLLRVNGKSKVSISHECSVVSVDVRDNRVVIELVKDYADAPAEDPLPLNTHVILTFNNAKLEADLANKPGDKLEEATQLYDLKPFEVTQEDVKEGYRKALEVDAWDDGRYSIYYTSATVEFHEPKV